MQIRAYVSFRLESELAEPIAAWLERAGFTVRMEVPILGRRADLLGLRPGSLMAIEAKMNNWAQALRQAIAYQLGADRSWVAMPLAAASRAYRQRWHFEAERVGLLAIDDQGGVRSAIPAGPSPRLLPFLRDKILEDRGPANPTGKGYLRASDSRTLPRFARQASSGFNPGRSKPSHGRR